MIILIVFIFLSENMSSYLQMCYAVASIALLYWMKQCIMQLRLVAGSANPQIFE